MAANVHRLRDKPGETEKITINVGYVDLGRIDLLVNEGFYSNRTDLIRTAIRNQLATHADAVKNSITRQTLELGSQFYSRADLEAVKSAGSKLSIQVVGLATIASDVTPELALSAIEFNHCPWRVAGQQTSQGGARRPDSVSEGMTRFYQGYSP